MRRWRTKDGRFLVEGDLPSGVQFYRLDKEHNVDRVYKEEKRTLGGELHQIGFTLLGRELMCRHTIDRERSTEDQSRVEESGLEPLTPAEEPVEKVCREAIARHKLGAETVEEAKRAQIEKLAAAAPESIRPTFRRLAERVVLDSDPLARQMISLFAALGALRKSDASSTAASEVAPMIELAAQLLTLDPAAKDAELPSIGDSKVADFVDGIERLRADVVRAAAAGSNFTAAGSQAVAYQKVADVLRAATVKLLAALPVEPT